MEPKVLLTAPDEGVIYRWPQRLFSGAGRLHAMHLNASQSST